jgi:two-component system sensor histidine kinase MprB
MTLRTRIAVLAASAVAVTVLLASAGAYFTARNQLLDEVDRSLDELAGQVQALPGLLVLPRANRGPFARDVGFEVIYLQLIFEEGDPQIPAGQNLNLPLQDADRDVASRIRPAIIRSVTVDDNHLRMVTVPLTGRGLTGGALQIARSLEEVDNSLDGLAVRLGIAGVGGVALAAALGLVVSRRVVRPLERLTDAAEHVAATQELAAHIDIDGSDEIGRLAVSFNAMLSALEESRSQQRRLVRDASHELRTPLTALRTNIEVLHRRDELTEAQRRELLDDATFELAQLSELVTELVDLATEAGAGDEPPVDIALDELVDRAVARFERRTGREVTVDLEPMPVSGHSGLLERAVSNLLDNADKWNPPGAAIDVTLRAGRLSVRDRGPGIDEADRPKVFDRFYRSVSARTTPGSGLGLSIVNQVVADHGGEVFVDAPPDGGAVVGFTLPTRAPDPPDAGTGVDALETSGA